MVHEEWVDVVETVRFHGVDFDTAPFHGFLAEAMILHHHHRERASDLQIVLADAEAREDEGANRMHY